MNAFVIRGLMISLVAVGLLALPIGAQDPLDPALAQSPEEAIEAAEQGEEPAPAYEPIDPALTEEPYAAEQADPALAAETAPAEAAAEQLPLFSQAELDQMLAPIALYPDELLSQMLMAATYPLEVVEAARWSRAHPELKGQDAVRAAEEQSWDPSVKSLLAFPDLLARMDTDLEWTRQLGDAFLAQQDQVMDTVQALRQRAEDAGNLESNDHIEVEHDGGTIVLHDRYPDVVYVPYYSPYEVYGTWWWPAYRPVYWDPWPGYYSSGYYWWGPSIWVGSGFYYSNCDWHHREVRVVREVPFYYRRQRPINDVWVHEYRHRRGVPYRSQREHLRYAGKDARPPRDDRPHRAARTVDATRTDSAPAAGAGRHTARDPRRGSDRYQADRERNDTGTARTRPAERERQAGTASPTEPAVPVTRSADRAHPQQPRESRTERSYTQERQGRDAQPRAPERSYTPAPQPAPAQSYSRPAAPPERSYSRPAPAQPAPPVERAQPRSPERSAPARETDSGARTRGSAQPRSDRGRPQAQVPARPQRSEAPRQQSLAAAQPRQYREAPRQQTPRQESAQASRQESRSDNAARSGNDGARGNRGGSNRRER